MYWELLILSATLGFAYSYFAKLNINRQRSIQSNKEQRIKRNVLCHDKLLKQPVNEVSTLYELFSYACKHYAENNLFGHREVLDVKKVDKLVFPKLSSYKWKTYRQIEEQTLNLSRALFDEFEFEPETKVLIFAETQAKWLVTAHACWAQSWTIVTAYANLGNEGLVHCFSSCDAPIVFTTADKLKMIGDIAPDCKNIKYVVVYDEVSEKDKESLSQKGIKLFSFSEFENKKSSKDVHPPKPDHLAVLMFTSGSTGLPKAVMIAHSHLIASISGLGYPVPLKSTDTYIAYLPLAHVLELVVENLLIFKGAALGYASPRTLTDQGVHECKGDIAELRPTLMAGVPAVWEKIRKATNDRIQSLSPNMQKLFGHAFNFKRFLLHNGLPTFFLDKTIFAKTVAATGGRLRLIISGGAPISSESQEFLRICLCAPCLQGYGLTETCGGGCVLPEDSLALKCVGAPVPCCEIKLIDVPELKYFSNEDKGEILIRGANITRGYWKNEEKTKSEFDDEGWFHTGDVGEWNPDGTLKIIDRVKNITKLSHGEYIALESLESTYSTSQFVEQISIYADSDRDSCIGIVVPRKKTLESWASEKGIKESFEQLCKNKEARKAVLESFHQIAREKNKPKVEYPSNVILSSEEWTPESGMLTAAMKLNRGQIKQEFKSQIEEAYKK